MDWNRMQWWNDMMSYLSMQQLHFAQTHMPDQDKIYQICIYLNA